MNWGRGLGSGEVALREGAGQGDKTCKTWKWEGGSRVQEVEVEEGPKQSVYDDAVMWPTLYRKGKLRRSWWSCALVLQCVRPQDTLCFESWLCCRSSPRVQSFLPTQEKQGKALVVAFVWKLLDGMTAPYTQGCLDLRMCGLTVTWGGEWDPQCGK